MAVVPAGRDVGLRPHDDPARLVRWSTYASRTKSLKRSLPNRATSISGLGVRAASPKTLRSISTSRHARSQKPMVTRRALELKLLSGRGTERRGIEFEVPAHTRGVTHEEPI